MFITGKTIGLQSCVVIIALFGLLFIATCGSIAWAQQGSNDQGQGQQPLMTPAYGQLPPPAPAPDSRAVLMDHLHFNMYEAAAGNLSSCEGDESCLKNAKDIQSWLCAANACDGTNTNKEPIACFNGLFDQYSIHDQEQISAAICPVIKSPSAETRRALLAHISDPNATEDDVVESGAYLLALKGSAVSCENYIKSYVGAYGPQWKYNWYRALSGCRILAHETTREQEEKDFHAWFGVAQGFSSCSDIMNSEMRDTCNTPGTDPSP